MGNEANRNGDHKGLIGSGLPSLDEGEASCQAVRSWLSDHIRPEGTPQPEEAIVAHLQSCAACRRAANLMGQLVQGLDSLGKSLQPPPDLASRALAQLAQERAPPLRPYQIFASLGAALGVAILAFQPTVQLAIRQVFRGNSQEFALRGDDHGASHAKGDLTIDEKAEVELTVSLRDANGRLLSSGAVIDSSVSPSLQIKVSLPCYVYASHISPTGLRTVLSPEKSDTAPRLFPGEQRKIPSFGGFSFTEEPGRENFVVVASTRPLDKTATGLCQYLGLPCAGGMPPALDVIEPEPPQLRIGERGPMDKDGVHTRTAKNGVAVVHLWIKHRQPPVTILNQPVPPPVLLELKPDRNPR